MDHIIVSHLMFYICAWESWCYWCRSTNVLYLRCFRNPLQKSFWVPMGSAGTASAALASDPSLSRPHCSPCLHAVCFKKRNFLSWGISFEQNAQYKTLFLKKAFMICGKGSLCFPSAVLLDSRSGALMGPSRAAPQCSWGSQGCVWFQAHQ